MRICNGSFFVVDSGTSLHHDTLLNTRKGLVMPSTRKLALDLLKTRNLSATAIAGELGGDRNTVSHALIRAHKAGEVRVVEYLRTVTSLAPVYALGGGTDVERPAPFDQSAYSAEYRARHPDRHRASSRAWRERNLDYVLAKQAGYRALRRAGANVQVPPAALPAPVAPLAVWSRADEPVTARPIAPQSSEFQTAPLPKEPAMLDSSLQYFEIPEIPGVKRFHCVRLRADLSIDNCRDRYEKSNSNDADADRFRTCRQCAHGARHSGRTDPNPSPLRGATVCARCHTGATRLIGKWLCVSCMNRQYEVLKGKNAKGTAPIKLAKLDRRAITYRAGAEVKTLVRGLTVDMEELVIATLRDESNRVAFCFRAPAAMDWLLGDEFDRSISDTPDDISVTPEPVTGKAAVVPSPALASPMGVECDGEPVTVEFDVLPVDPYAALREAVEQIERDAPANVHGMSRRAAKKARQKARKQVRVSSITIGLLRNVGALPAPAPVTRPVPVPVWRPMVPENLALLHGVFTGG
jgi:hypothetical protein